ncbi:hypothetical protein ACH5RR_023811 [Cinchona calisaya]|uniref:Uncharacterized protein n=1 Tax=Cinchona calisaya TaxID=153742 RepID=A0ABD2ZD57_9GENT
MPSHLLTRKRKKKRRRRRELTNHLKPQNLYNIFNHNSKPSSQLLNPWFVSHLFFCLFPFSSLISAFVPVFLSLIFAIPSVLLCECASISDIIFFKVFYGLLNILCFFHSCKRRTRHARRLQGAVKRCFCSYLVGIQAPVRKCAPFAPRLKAIWHAGLITGPKKRKKSLTNHLKTQKSKCILQLLLTWTLQIDD